MALEALLKRTHTDPDSLGDVSRGQRVKMKNVRGSPP